MPFRFLSEGGNLSKASAPDFMHWAYAMIREAVNPCSDSAMHPYVVSMPCDLGVSSPSPVTIKVLRTQRHVGNRSGDGDVP